MGNAHLVTLLFVLELAENKHSGPNKRVGNVAVIVSFQNSYFSIKTCAWVSCLSVLY